MLSKVVAVATLAQCVGGIYSISQLCGKPKLTFRKVPALLVPHRAHFDPLGFKKHVDRMEERRSDIRYIAGERTVVSSRFLESSCKRGFDVLYMADPIVEYNVHGLRQFVGKSQMLNVQNKN